MSITTLQGSYTLDRNSLTCKVGVRDILVFEIADRYVHGGRRRGRDTAIKMHGMLPNAGFGAYVSATIAIALQTLIDLGYPTEEFIMLLHEKEWGDQLPVLAGQLGLAL